MKSARAIIFVLIFCLGLGAIAQQAPMNPPTPAAPPPTDLNTHSFANPTGHQFSQREHWKVAY